MRNRLASCAPGSVLLTTEAIGGGGGFSPSNAKSHIARTWMSIHVYA